jgi:hypothetical protein
MTSSDGLAGTLVLFGDSVSRLEPTHYAIWLRIEHRCLALVVTVWLLRRNNAKIKPMSTHRAGSQVSISHEAERSDYRGDRKCKTGIQSQEGNKPQKYQNNSPNQAMPGTTNTPELRSIRPRLSSTSIHMV